MHGVDEAPGDGGRVTAGAHPTSVREAPVHHAKVAALLLWRWRYRVPLVASAVAALWYFGVPLLLGPIVPVDAAVEAEFVQSVVASGHVEAPFRVNIGSQIVGVVADVPVSEGQTVKAGDALILLDDREARAAVVQAEGAVAQAEARLRQLRELVLPSAQEALRQANATLTSAQQTYDRTAALAANEYATKAALDDATRILSIARAQVRNAEFQVYTNRPGGSDYVMAETLLNQANAGLVTARSRLNYTVIAAPRDGILISRNVERGNVVQPTDILMKLSPAGEIQLVVQIDEKNLGLIAVGQKALASADAYAQESFAAEVAYINPGVDLQRAAVEVKLRVAQPPTYLSQDMTISADIEVARHPGALVVPAASLRGVANGKPWVMKANASHATRQPVKLGLVGGGRAEILDGLKAGDLVVPATSAVKEGARIRARLLSAPEP